MCVVNIQLHPKINPKCTKKLVFQIAAKTVASHYELTFDMIITLKVKIEKQHPKMRKTNAPILAGVSVRKGTNHEKLIINK